MLGAALTAACFFLTMTGAASAFMGSCLLEVEGKTYLDGPCNIEIGADGSFSIGAGDETRSEYFAYVNLGANAGTAAGFWNGVEAADRAHDNLGELTRDGGCWTNALARVCAWRSQ